MSPPPLPRVSILLPCRDAGPFLPECIASLRSQTEPRFEVLVVDDGSADDTRAILASWAEADARVRPVEPTAPGLVPALNAMAVRARAPLVARMDADDVADPERLAAQVALMEGRPDVGACGTRVRYVPRDAAGPGYRRYEKWLNGLTEPDALRRDLFVECPIAHPTLMIRRHILEELDGYREFDGPEDYDLVLRIAAGGHLLANVPEVLLDWRLGPHRHSERSARYSAAAFRRLKVAHLAGPLGAAMRGRPVVIWGAGKVGKAFARAWLEAGGARLDAFVDLDPRKIGQEIHGAPVIDPAALERRFAGPGARPFVLVAVGSPGARSDIRRALDAMGAGGPGDGLAVA